MDKIARGIAADHLLKNELLREILNTMDEAYTAAWRAAKTVEAREDCHRYATLLTNFVADIQSVANTGAIEAERQRQLEGKPRDIGAWPMTR